MSPIFITQQRLKHAFAILICCAVSACAGAPVQEMSDARQAIRAARAAGAEKVAPHQLSEARSLMERAEVNLQSRAYRDARKNALAARSKAVEALEVVHSEIRPESG
jgi:Domain of unknown function (DUF4398)